MGPATLTIQEQIRQFGVKDANDVAGWISNYGRARNGRWIPDPLAD